MLKDPRWQHKRLEALQAADFSCQKCATTSRALDVHHTLYVPGRNPWEYELEDLRVLCEDCHRSEHGLPPSPVAREREARLQRRREVARQVHARAVEIAQQRAGQAPRTPLEEEIASVQELIPIAEKSGDAAYVHSLLERAVELNKRRLGMGT